jgi:glycosyltransferase involved in cell wall biosynthesis
MPAVTIIVPVYNVETYLEKCLTALVNQTLHDIQIIIVDDGSTDESCKIIEKFKEKYSEKIICVKKENGGLSDARNVGMRYATGDYIGFVDGDDYIDVNMYEKMYNKAKEVSADLVECDFFWEYTKRIKQDIGKFYELKDILVKLRVMAWNKIIKRVLIEKNNIKYPVGLRYEDIEFTYKLIPYINKVGFVKDSLYHYLQRNSSISHIQNDKTCDIFTVLSNVINFYKEKGFYEKYQEQIEYIYMRFLLGSSFLRMVKIGDRKTRRRILEENWEKLNTQYPDWKKNKILTKSRSLKDVYFKTVNRFTYRIYSMLFHVIRLEN